MADRIEKTVELEAPVAQVWRALTDHKEFGTWFRVDLEGPFVPGEFCRGRITFPGCEGLKWEVEVVEMTEPRYFSFRWHPYAVDPDIDYSKEEPTLVEFRLEPIANGTRLTVVESGFEAIPDRRMPEAMRENEKGWGIQMNNIKAHVEH